jgi:hypothetical protein
LFFSRITPWLRNNSPERGAANSPLLFSRLLFDTLFVPEPEDIIQHPESIDKKIRPVNAQDRYNNHGNIDNDVRDPYIVLCKRH